MNFGIICEFNPFHVGHKYLFDRARELGAKNIVCAMSGNAVQRGELAIFDKYKRARTALLNGADLVLELPFPWSAGSAEYFATAGIKALSQYCDAIIFGSECGNIELLSRAAEIALTDEFINEFETQKKSGEGAASAYFSLLEERIGIKLSSNDILGVEYIKAAKKCGANLKFYTVCRLGNAYRDNNIHDGEIPSASAIRRALLEENDEALMRVQRYTEQSLRLALRTGEITNPTLLEKFILAHFRLCAPSDISSYAECDGGVAERICSVARESVDIDGFFDELKTKRYTDAKMRRAILFALTRVERKLLLQTPEYLYLLAANESGRELLSTVKKSGREDYISVVTKPADAPRESEQFIAEERLNAIFSLARERALPMSEAYKKNAFVIHD